MANLTEISYKPETCSSGSIKSGAVTVPIKTVDRLIKKPGQAIKKTGKAMSDLLQSTLKPTTAEVSLSAATAKSSSIGPLSSSAPPTLSKSSPATPMSRPCSTAACKSGTAVRKIPMDELPGSPSSPHKRLSIQKGKLAVSPNHMKQEMPSVRHAAAAQGIGQAQKPAWQVADKSPSKLTSPPPPQAKSTSPSASGASLLGKRKTPESVLGQGSNLLSNNVYAGSKNPLSGVCLQKENLGMYFFPCKGTSPVLLWHSSAGAVGQAKLPLLSKIHFRRVLLGPGTSIRLMTKHKK